VVAPASAPAGFYAAFTSAELDAWNAYGRATKGINYPQDKRGRWHFPTRWPPAYGERGEDCRLERTPRGHYITSDHRELVDVALGRGRSRSPTKADTVKGRRSRATPEKKSTACRIAPSQDLAAISTRSTWGRCAFELPSSSPVRPLSHNQHKARLLGRCPSIRSRGGTNDWPYPAYACGLCV
jgi:hypothetical protein